MRISVATPGRRRQQTARIPSGGSVLVTVIPGRGPVGWVAEFPECTRGKFSWPGCCDPSSGCAGASLQHLRQFIAGCGEDKPAACAVDEGQVWRDMTALDIGDDGHAQGAERVQYGLVLGE